MLLFDDAIAKWATFKFDFLEFFSNIRIKNSSQSKRRFLSQALRGEAMSLVENLGDSDFEMLWNILTDFYDDPFRGANVHCNNLFGDKGQLTKFTSLRKKLVHYRQNSSGLKVAYNELKLDGFD